MFISHDSRDAAFAEAFGKLLKSVSAGKIKSFRSSDKSGTDGIEFGEEWYRALMSKLGDASDVVCLLTDRSLERPWILYEAGVAKGKLSTPVHALTLGMRQVGSGPFSQFHYCDDSEESLSKLMRQLCDRVTGFEPHSNAIRSHIRNFRQTMIRVLKKEARPHGSITWRRQIPVKDKLASALLKRVNAQLDAVRGEAKLFFEERDVHLQPEYIRTNLLLPDCQFHEKSQFPGQLCFLTTRPAGSFSQQELGNRFAPGEGVSGKVFLDGVAFAEDGRAGVSAKKLRVMHRKLAAVAGFPLLDPAVQYAFGVVCIDFLAHDIDDQDLHQLLSYGPIVRAIRNIASLLNPHDNESFELVFAARF